MGDVVELGDAIANRLIDRAEVRGAFWFDQSGYPQALAQLPLAPSVRAWMRKAMIQAWAEGGITAAQEYGDEMRAANSKPKN